MGGTESLVAAGWKKSDKQTQTSQTPEMFNYHPSLQKNDIHLSGHLDDDNLPG